MRQKKSVVRAVMPPDKKYASQTEEQVYMCINVNVFCFNDCYISVKTVIMNQEEAEDV